MNVGTKSLLFGVHQIVLHPIFVAMAWRRLYGRWPNWREAICIVVHDWGYWGCPNMDGQEGQRHPVLGGRIAGCLLGRQWSDFTIAHSRHYANTRGIEPSPLCWADKLSWAMYPAWLYVPLARASGEIREYRQMAARISRTHRMYVSLNESDWYWFRKLKAYGESVAETRSGLTVPKMPELVLERESGR